MVVRLSENETSFNPVDYTKMKITCSLSNFYTVYVVLIIKEKQRKVFLVRKLKWIKTACVKVLVSSDLNIQFSTCINVLGQRLMFPCRVYFFLLFTDILFISFLLKVRWLNVTIDNLFLRGAWIFVQRIRCTILCHENKSS